MSVPVSCNMLTDDRESISTRMGRSVCWIARDNPSMHALISASRASLQLNNSLQDEYMIVPLVSQSTMPAPALPSSQDMSVFSFTEPGGGGSHLTEGITTGISCELLVEVHKILMLFLSLDHSLFLGRWQSASPSNCIGISGTQPSVPGICRVQLHYDCGIFSKK